MNPSPLAVWHHAVKTRSAAGLADVMADDAVFHSPVVHTPQVGKAIMLKYLSAALACLIDDSFQYVREVVSGRDAVLEFEVELDGIRVNGVDMIAWNEDGKITNFKVMIRPLKAINVVHQRMGAMLQKQAG